MIQDININSLDCTGEKSWEHGSSLINYMKLTTFNGLSGMIQFDSQGKIFQDTRDKYKKSFKGVSFYVSFCVKFGYMGCRDFSICNPSILVSHFSLIQECFLF